jgi:hypothetical protein
MHHFAFFTEIKLIFHIDNQTLQMSATLLIESQTIKQTCLGWAFICNADGVGL